MPNPIEESIVYTYTCASCDHTWVGDEAEGICPICTYFMNVIAEADEESEEAEAVEEGEADEESEEAEADEEDAS